MIFIIIIGEKTSDSFLTYLQDNNEMVNRIINNFDLKFTDKIDLSKSSELRIVLTESLKPGSIKLSNGDEVKWDDRKTFKKNLNNQIVNIDGVDNVIKIGSSVSGKTSMVISDSEGARKGKQFEEKGGFFTGTDGFINLIENGDIDNKLIVDIKNEKINKDNNIEL